jgi:hypothetical protein
MKRHLAIPAGFILLSFIPYHCKAKGSLDPPEPEPKARTSAEAVRSFVRRKFIRPGSIVQVFTPEAIRNGGPVFEHRHKEYRRPRI